MHSPWEAKALHAPLLFAGAPARAAAAAARSCNILQAFSITDGRKGIIGIRCSSLEGVSEREKETGFV